VIYNLDWMEYVLIFLYKKVNHNYLKLFERRELAPAPHASSHRAVDTVGELLLRQVDRVALLASSYIVARPTTACPTPAADAYSSCIARAVTVPRMSSAHPAQLRN